MPLFVPIYTLIILMFTETASRDALSIKENVYLLPLSFKYIVLSIFIILVVVAPGLSLLIMKKNEQVESIELDNQRERLFPILVTAFYSFVLTLILFKQIDTRYFPTLFHGIAILGVISATLSAVINLMIKMSLHALSMGMSVGILIYAYHTFYIANLSILIGIILLSGIVMTARYVLKKHSLQELILGYSLGICLSFITLTLVKDFL